MKPQHLHNYIKKLKQSGIERHIPNITEQNAEYIKHIIREQRPHHILEIGTANGYSTLHFAQALSEFSSISQEFSPPALESPSTATVTTIEYAWNAHNEAVEHFKNCKIKNIHALWWDAKMILPTLREMYFDFVYIDAMKREYLDYLILSLPLMTPDALIVIDDVEKYRDKMHTLYEWLEWRNIPYTLQKTDIDDSIMLIHRQAITFNENNSH